MSEEQDGPDAASLDPVPGEEPAVEEHEPTGLDLARSIARGLAGRTGSASTSRAGRSLRRRVPRETSSSGAHPDDRDPQLIDLSVGRIVADQGWETDLKVHGVFARWEGLVGREVGAHVRPESFAEGRLVVRTDSTAWATQMKLLAPDVVRRLNDVLGHGTVRVIEVLGPRSPSWSRGRLRVKGRGPRDTYG
ncbi:MAG: hypothetical protein JWR42_1949 [Marmoricola sp.]|nr:hypothetical protein [Marmoricola sp.]